MSALDKWKFPPTIIGLLGPARSGKDLVADRLADHGFLKIAFADPIKRFAQRAFGFDKETLWGESSLRNKEADIDQGWWIDAVERFNSSARELINDVLESTERVRGYVALTDWLSNLRKTYPDKISARVVLQTLGTEWGRAVVPDLWVRYLYKTIHRFDSHNLDYTQEEGVIDPPDGEPGIGTCDFVIPDHRFLNEVQATQANGGYVVRLRRLALEAKEEIVGVAGHRSEAEQKGIQDNEFNLVLEFPEGVETVNDMVEEMYQKKWWTSGGLIITGLNSPSREMNMKMGTETKKLYTAEE